MNMSGPWSVHEAKCFLSIQSEPRSQREYRVFFQFRKDPFASEACASETEVRVRCGLFRSRLLADLLTLWTPATPHGVGLQVENHGLKTHELGPQVVHGSGWYK